MYFVREDDIDPTGSIPINAITEITRLPRCMFNVHTPGRIYNLQGTGLFYPDLTVSQR